jgi:hypothetical protein
MLKLFSLALLAAICSPALFAQGRVAIAVSRPAAVSGQHGAPGTGIQRSSRIIVSGGMRRHSFSRPSFFYGYGAPYFYSDYYEPYQEEYARPEPPAQPAPIIQVKNEPLPNPVLLELRGNQWVRVTTFTQAPGEATAVETQYRREKRSAEPEKSLPAVLIYRDGHREEISSYSIIGHVIYAKADYWSNGAWTRNIQVADLDVPATLRENEQRGVKFELPSGPDEVMIRP